ncbi:MAG: peptidoglycan DD-metalloendopeptidase family protein, partial [Synergistaceae bacterium]|nr:peptidoglycan DD-metalloendopeptidase family protein [Synergistaceae bacterium]
MMKKFIAVLLMLVMVLDLTAYGASKTAAKSQSDMKKKIQQYNNIAREKSKQSKTLLGQLSRLKQDASASQAKMNDLEKENIKLQNSVGEINKKIAKVRESMTVIINALRARLLDIYKHTPEENSLSLIMTSNGPHDALNTAYMLQCFARQDSEMLEELVRRENELNEARRQLETNKTQIQRQTEELKKKRAEYDSTIKKTDSLLKNVQSEQKKAEAAAKELEAAQRAVGNKINSLSKQKKTSAAKKTQTAKLNSQPAQTSSASSVKSLIWPVNGTVTMQYGSRVHPVFKTKVFNSGIDIKAAPGTPIKAAGPGEVLYQGWLRGFGQVVIIDHGGDLSTVYAHLGGANVR